MEVDAASAPGYARAESRQPVPPGLSPYDKEETRSRTAVGTPQKQLYEADAVMHPEDDLAGGSGLTQDLAQLNADDDYTGLTQDMADLHVNVPCKWLGNFLEQEILQHIRLVKAVHATRQGVGDVAIVYPESWADLDVILKKLAYSTWDSDAWKRLGFAMYEGDRPTEAKIQARART